MDAFLESLNFQFTTDLAIVVLRILIPIMGVIVVFQCYSSMRRQRRDEKPLIMLVNKQTDDCLPVLSWETPSAAGVAATSHWKTWPFRATIACCCGGRPAGL